MTNCQLTNLQRNETTKLPYRSRPHYIMWREGTDHATVQQSPALRRRKGERPLLKAYLRGKD